MNYSETLDFLFSQLPMYQRDGKAAYKANLDNTIAFDNYFGNPHKAFMSVHVAGTNGKGSTSHMVAAVLQAAGYKTGLYTSPHLRDFRERVRINGEPIPEKKVIAFVSKNQEKIQEIQPSFFEMTVAMAFNHFKEEAVDIAVIETGMGGRLDSTNIVDPLVSVITNIGLDHTQFLGDSIAAIAGEKAGIIKPKIPVVIGETHAVTKKVFTDKALEQKAPIMFADQRFTLKHISTNKEAQLFELNDAEGELSGEYALDLKGSYQLKNVLTALDTLSVLRKKLNISPDHIKQGLAHVVEYTGLKGRWQILQHAPKVICDTGHNQEGLQYIIDQLKKETYENLHIVFGMVNDKDAKKVLERLPKEAKFYFTQPSIPRAMKVEDLTAIAKECGLSGDSFNNVELALSAAKEQAKKEDLIFVGGSTFVVADIPEL